MNKKAEENLITEYIIFIVLNLLFFTALLFFVLRVGSGDSIKEEAYSKEIALTIDSIRPLTEVQINILELNDLAKKNKIKTNPIIFDFEKNLVTVRVTSGTGYSYHYFTKISPENINFDVNLLRISTIKNG